jgi:hypothetical protein
MRDCLHESFCSGIPFFCTNGSDDNAPNRRSGVRVYLGIYIFNSLASKLTISRNLINEKLAIFRALPYNGLTKWIAMIATPHVLAPAWPRILRQASAIAVAATLTSEVAHGASFGRGFDPTKIFSGKGLSSCCGSIHRFCTGSFVTGDRLNDLNNAVVASTSGASVPVTDIPVVIVLYKPSRVVQSSLGRPASETIRNICCASNPASGSCIYEETCTVRPGYLVSREFHT